MASLIHFLLLLSILRSTLSIENWEDNRSTSFMEDIPDNFDQEGDWMTGKGSEDRFEGDMLLTEEQRQLLNGTLPEERNGIIDKRRHWKNAIIPFVISSSFSSSDRAKIMKAINTYHTKTCIRFVPRTNETDYVSIIVGSGCYSYVGRRGRTQPLSLGRGCVYHYIIMHELMHAVGFYHEQSRCDRDKYVTIYLENVSSSRRHNFNKYSCSVVTSLGQPYDYSSVMHYRSTAFSSNGKKTIVAKNDANRRLGNTVGLTQTDVKKINLLYGCGGSTSPPLTTTTTQRPAVTSCNDLYPASNRCPYWAKTKQYCNNSSFRTWMSQACRKSCGKCSECKDMSSSCVRYRQAGYCTRPTTFDFYSRICPVSCQLCVVGTTKG